MTRKRTATHITHHTSHITHHISHITHHTSHITHHTSHVTCAARAVNAARQCSGSTNIPHSHCSSTSCPSYSALPPSAPAPFAPTTTTTSTTLPLFSASASPLWHRSVAAREGGSACNCCASAAPSNSLLLAWVLSRSRMSMKSWPCLSCGASSVCEACSG